MTSRPDPLVFLDDILDSLRLIRGYTTDVSEETFLADTKLQDAVIRRLLIIGEASARMPDAFRTAHPEIPWHKMTGMRNRLVHGYAEVNMAVVWDTLRNDLPPLKGRLSELLNNSDC